MLKPFNSILLCADRSSEAQDALRKASILARYLDAPIELFACDADHASAVAQAPQSAAARAALESCLASSRTYVEALRGSIAATDLRIMTSVGCARGMAEGIVDRVQAARHDLVVKSFETGPERVRRAATSGDLRLAQQCRVPLLLTRARPWSTPLQIRVALDLRRCDATQGRRVLDIARTLAKACHGRCAVVYCERRGSSAELPVRGLAEARAMFGLEDEAAVEVLEGAPVEVLLPTLRAADADLLVIARGPAGGRHATPERLTERLLGEGGSDVLVIPEEPSMRAVSGLLTPLATDAPHRQH